MLDISATGEWDSQIQMMGSFQMVEFVHLAFTVQTVSNISKI